MTVWSGRFADDPAEALWDFTVDRADRRLLLDDTVGSIAHARMLGRAGIVTDEESTAMIEGLDRIRHEAISGTFEFSDTDEDVHTAVERRLVELVGDVGRKLHSGRSRNDQVALDLHLYLQRSARERVAQLLTMVDALASRAREHAATVIPSYTHLQQAQAVTLGHHLLAHAWALLRDAERFHDGAARTGSSPLGAGAGGGSSLPLDPASVAAELGLDRVFENSLDAVAARDGAAEYVFSCAQAMIHLSRLGEEVILWTTSEFDWAAMPDRLATGSSALPQKKNPDIAELVRGRSARVVGDLTALLALQKALPLAYDRDLQEDKPAVFDADDTLSGSLAAMTALVEGLEFHPPPPSSWVTSLDLAEALVARGVPFREAHGAVGGLVLALVEQGRELASIEPSELTNAHPAFREEDLARIDPEVSVAARRSPGGGSPESVAAQLARLDGRVAVLREWAVGEPA